MSNETAVRVIDELGRIVLPVEVRRSMGWDKKTRVEIRVEPEDNQLIMKTHVPTCVYCGAEADLLEYRDRRICISCRNEIADLSR